MEILQPPLWPRPKGYSNGIAASGKMVFVSGMVGWNADGMFESDDFVAQTRQALLNVVTVLREAGALPEHIVRMTWYVTDRDAYHAAQRDIGVVYREIIGNHYPAMTAVAVLALMETAAKLEVEVTAVIPMSWK